MFIKWYDNGPLPSSKNPHFQNEAKCTAFLVKMSFICMRMKNYFHIKGWALNLVLIQRRGRTRKWSITLGREMQIPNGKPLKALMCVFGQKNKNKRKEADIYWLNICSFYFRRDFVCRYCGGPLNEDVTCRILAGNKPNTVYWLDTTFRQRNKRNIKNLQQENCDNTIWLWFFFR